MKIKNIKLIVIIIAMLLMLLFLKTEARAAVVGQTELILDYNIEEIKENEPVTIDVLVKNPEVGVLGIDFYLQYNEDIFEPITQDSFTNNLEAEFFNYFPDDGELMISLENTIYSEGNVCTITLIPKVTIEETENRIQLLKLYDLTICDEKGNPTVSPDLFAEYERSFKIAIGEGIYLESPKYKIGIDGNTQEYVEGDLYISKVYPKTTKEDFMRALETNPDAEMKVLRKDGTELTNGSYVGTGMKLVVIRADEEVILQIAVKGDLNGDGKIEAIDLSAVNQAALRTITLKNEYLIAGDINGDGEIGALDLSGINQVVLGLIEFKEVSEQSLQGNVGVSIEDVIINEEQQAIDEQQEDEDKTKEEMIVNEETEEEQIPEQIEISGGEE